LSEPGSRTADISGNADTKAVGKAVEKILR